MAVIVSNGNVGLSTVNGWLRSDAYNLTPTGQISLATGQFQSLTFANEAKCKGAILRLQNLDIINDRSVRLDLEENKGTVTLTISYSGIVTMTAHGFSNNQAIRLSTTGALLTGLIAGTLYYIVPPQYSPNNMTTNSAPTPFVAAASGEYTTYSAYKAFNNTITLTESWRVASSTNSWLRLDFGNGTSKIISKYSITAPPSGTNETPSNWTFEGTNDATFTNWTILDSRTSQTGWTAGEVRIFSYSNTTAYRWYRINITSNSGGTTYTTISELRMFGMQNINDFSLSTSQDGLPIVFSGTQSGTHSLWIVVNSRELSNFEINPELAGIYDNAVGAFAVPFDFLDGGTTITTASNKWRFFSIQTNGTVGTWNIGISTSANWNYVTWSDVQVTFSDNDCIICKDYVTIDKSATLKGVLTSGETTYNFGICAIICRSLDISTPYNQCLLQWENNPNASYTITQDGVILISSFSGIKIGSELNPIPYLKQAIWNQVTPTVGTLTSIKGYGALITGVTHSIKTAFLIYGEVPTIRYATLLQDAAIGQANLVCEEDLSSSGWLQNDYIFIGKQDISGYGVTTWHQINSISGNIITLKTNLATNIRKAGATIINRERYGVKLMGTSFNSMSYINFNHFVVDGAFLNVIFWQLYVPTYSILYFANIVNRSQYKMTNNVILGNTSYDSAIATVHITDLGFLFSNNLCYSVVPISDLYTTTGKVGIFEISNNKILSCYNNIINYPHGSNARNKLLIYNNKFENYGNASYGIMTSASIIMYNNDVWGIGTTYGFLVFGNTSTGEIYQNTYNNCLCVYTLGLYSTIFIRIQNEILNNIKDNIIDILYSGDQYQHVLFNNCNQIKTIDKTTILDLAEGSEIHFNKFNTIENNEFTDFPNGQIKKTGLNLADSTVRTIGGYAMRFESTNISGSFSWSFTIPTGNIQNKTIIIGVWCKINSENYYSGINKLPKLKINYDDNINSAYFQAAAKTDWQYLFLPITPTTAFGQITVSLIIETDKLSSDSYVYFDDISVFYPPNTNINLGSLDLWANGLPVVPPIAIQLNASDIWAYLKSAANVTGSIGEYLGNLATDAKLLDTNNKITEIHKITGLDAIHPMEINKVSGHRSADDIIIKIDESPSKTIATRQ